jgi:AmmeMemoRadiSam system protein A
MAAAPMHLTDAQSRQLLDLARQTIRATLLGDDPPPMHTDDRGLLQPAGCFVSLHVAASHALRGCVGRMEAIDPLIRNVQEAAISVLGDPRFDDRPVTLDELADLAMEISVLSPLRPVPTPRDFDLLVDGVYLEFAGRSGVFLPQVARETGWSKEKLLDRLCTEKLGVAAGSWRSAAAKLKVFSTLVLGPVPFDH